VKILMPVHFFLPERSAGTEVSVLSVNFSGRISPSRDSSTSSR